jgi:group I intron endonuclease
MGIIRLRLFGGKQERKSPSLSHSDRLNVQRRVFVYQIYCEGNSTVYVGKAVRLAERWRNHRHALSTGKHINTFLQRSWNKYGPDAFKFELLNIAESEEIAFEMEREWIATYRRSGIRLFNLTDGGDGISGYTRPPEVIERISAAQRGKPRKSHDEDTRRRISANLKGFKRTPEEIEKSRQSRIGTKRTPEQRERMKQAWVERRARKTGNANPD